MLDRIVQTLHEKILDWRTINKKNRGRVGGLFGRDKAGQESLLVERFTAGLELARALRYLHFKRIIYRDLKPENIGFDSEGVLKLFDFGLAKELKPKDLVEKPDGYDCTGLTGSRRYMSPECLLCRLYGFSADVYSFGILLWQILALKTPFAVYDASQHFVIVVEKNHRPPRLPHLPSQINMMMEESWSRNPRKRPTFKQICQILQVSLTQRSGSSTSSDTDRSTHVTERSIRSLRESDNSIVASACECE
jgi:serine/threonine protein kinase